MKLLPFHSLCAACLSKDASTRFCDISGHYDGTSNAMGQPEQPHLHRVCVTCGYEWLEHCAAIKAVDEDARS